MYIPTLLIMNVDCCKGIVHTEINMLSSFTRPYMFDLLLWNMKEDILKNVDISFGVH